MESIFTINLINQYNEYFNPLIIKCKTDDVKMQDFDKIIQSRGNYNCCIQLKQKKTISHSTLPIMIGSTIDKYLRKIQKNEDDPLYQLYGTFLLNGSIVIIPNFLTNNLRGGHCYYYKKFKALPLGMQKFYLSKKFKGVVTYRILIMEDNKKYTLEFFENHVYLIETITGQICKRKRRNENHKQHKNIIQLLDINDEYWVNFLNLHNPYGNFSKDEYLNFVNVCKKHSPKLDDIGNKVIVSPPTALYEAIKLLHNFDATKIRNTLNRGNLFFALSNNKNTNYTLNIQHKTIHTCIEGHKIEQSQMIIPTIRRHTNHKTHNSPALFYAKDAFPYICPCTVKDMKEAGENLMLTKNTIISQEVSLDVINKYFKQKRFQKTSENQTIQIILNGYLTNYYIPHNIDIFMEIKKQLNVTLILRKNYLIIQHTGNIPIKYSKELKMFISPKECEIFNFNVFRKNDPFDVFSCYGGYLSDYFACMLPEKQSVTINNIKGKACTLKNAAMANVFLRTNNYNTALFHPIASNESNTFTIKFIDKEFQLNDVSFYDYTHLAIIPNMKMPENVKAFFTEYEPVGGIPKDFNCNRYNLEEVLQYYPYKIHDRNFRISTDYIQHHFELYCAFGDIEGYTNEDGIILDKNFVENGPNLLISNTLHIRFKNALLHSSTNINYTKMANVCEIHYIPINLQFETTIFFGILCSSKKLTPISNGGAIQINCAIIGNNYYYSIYLESFARYQNIESFLLDGSVIVNFRIIKKLSISSKLLINHGQKGVVSHITDLSKFKAYTKDGKCIHPQMLMSPLSIIGRTTASQCRDMLNNAKLAVTEYGEFVSPVQVTVHHLDIVNEARLNLQKIDLFTAENGCLANNLSHTYNILESMDKNPHEKFHIPEQLFAASNFSFEFV